MKICDMFIQIDTELIKNNFQIQIDRRSKITKYQQKNKKKKVF